MKIIKFFVSLTVLIGSMFRLFFIEDNLLRSFYLGLVVISSLATFAYIEDRSPLKVMKLSNFKKNYKSYLLGTIIAFLATFIILGILYLSGNVTQIEFNFDNLYYVFILIVVFIVQSLYEEILIRGLFLDVMRRLFGFLVAIIASSLIFAILHISNPDFTFLSFINILLYGLISATLVHKQGHLYFVSGFHFGWNFLQSLILGVISGIKIEKPLITTTLNDNLLTGGEFGFENSYLTLIILIIMLLITFNYKVKRTSFQWINKFPLAHRGYFNDENPENSLGAFKNAVNNGFAIELDVHLSKDNEVVVFHDYTLNRMCGINGKVKDYNVSELKKFRLYDTEWTIPTLKEVLKLVDGKVPLIIEIKNSKFPGLLERKVYELIKDYQGDYVVQSFNPFSMMWYVDNAPHIIRGQLSGKHDDKESGNIFTRFFLRHLLFNVFAQADYINIDINYDNWRIRHLSKKMYKIGYTARSREEYIKAMSTFDNVIFDNFTYDDDLRAKYFTKE